MHYEMCIQSLIAQVKDLRTQNLELQRSEQELSHAVASTAGIGKSYGDQMTQVLSTLAKFDAAVVLPFSVQPSLNCIYYPNACPDSGWPRGGEEHHEHPHHQEPTSWRGTAEKQKEPGIPEWRAAPEGEEHPKEPTVPLANAEENTSSLGNRNPLTKNVSTSPGKFLYSRLSSYGHVYSFSSEGCTKCKWRCTPNHDSPRLPLVPNAYGAK